MSAKSTASVRMYRLNELGDCFLVTFATGTSSSRLLIDCGSFRNSSNSISRLRAIATDIASELKGKPLDVVIGTHQHNDHLNGFVHCSKIFRNDIGVGEVWLSWLDDPTDSMAQEIGKKHNNLIAHLFEISKRLHATRAGSRGSRSIKRLEDILGFYGASGTTTPPELPAEAIGILKLLGKKKPQYLRPGRVFDMPGLPVDSVRVYVLGPPRDNDLLYRKDPRAGESYDNALAVADVAAMRLLAASNNRSGASSREEKEYPFRESYKSRGRRGKTPALKKIMTQYNRREVSWRRIDDDWMQQAEVLGLFLDTYTNNSSLVLAFELVDSGKVLLFAADAQTGNWLSWPTVKWERGIVSTDDLLARTAFYKVGHHASHNATLVDAFEKMNNPELVALIPVHKKDPNIAKPDGWKMPARNLFKRLREKTSNRVLQMDGVNPATCDPKKDPASSSWAATGIKPKQTSLFTELRIGG